MWTEARAPRAALADVVRWMATAPADRVGLAPQGPDRGRAPTPTSCVLAPDETFVVDVPRLHHKNPVSAYAGRTLTGVGAAYLAARRPSRSTANPAAGC